VVNDELEARREKNLIITLLSGPGSHVVKEFIDSNHNEQLIDSTGFKTI